MKIKNYAEGWSKMIFNLLEFKPPVTHQKENCHPLTIISESNDGNFRIELKVANFAVKITITEIFVLKSPNIIVKKIIKKIKTFHDFSAEIVEAYCEAVGYVVNPRIRRTLTPDVINKLENNGWPIGMYGYQGE